MSFWQTWLAEISFYFDGLLLAMIIAHLTYNTGDITQLRLKIRKKNIFLLCIFLEKMLVFVENEYKCLFVFLMNVKIRIFIYLHERERQVIIFVQRTLNFY